MHTSSQLRRCRLDTRTVIRHRWRHVALALDPHGDDCIPPAHGGVHRRRCRYVAVVHGAMSAAEGEVDVPIRKDMDTPPLQLVDHVQVSIYSHRLLLYIIVY
jgi:hypothetical protein